jgi:HEAT repeat protein
MKASILALALVACLGVGAVAGEDRRLDLRAFDRRASTFLQRMRQAGMSVYRLVDLADLRVPRLKPGLGPKEALEKVAANSGLRLDWIDGKPLLWKPAEGKIPAGKLKLESADAVWDYGWTADRRVLANVLERSARKVPADVRRACAEAVLRFGRAPGVALLGREKTVALVRWALQDKDWLLRRQAVIAAADLGLADAADIVERAAADKHTEVRCAAALAAGRLGGEKGAAVLAALAEDKEKRVRYCVTHGCVALGGAPAVKVLAKLFDGKDAYLSVWASRAAGYVGGAEALKLLERAAKHKDPRKRRGAAIGLGRIRHARSVELLTFLVLDEARSFVRPNGPAAISLGLQGGADAVGALKEAWKKKGPGAEVVYGLGLAGTAEAREFLAGLTKHESPAIRSAAAWALGKSKKADAAPIQVEDIKVSVRASRPRVFLRATGEGGWRGPTLERMRGLFRRPDYQRRERKDKLPNSRIGQVILWMLSGDELAGLDAAGWTLEMISYGIGRTRGNTPSYLGISLQRGAAIYDWTHSHGDIDPVGRRLAMHHIAGYGDGFLNGWLKKKASTVFYSRRWGALAGCGVTGAAIFGDSPRGREQLAYALKQYYSEDGLGSIRQAQDGAVAGCTYGLHHLMTDTANLAAAIQSATDLDVAGHIRDKRGDWLQKQLYFQMHFTYPDGNFFKDGDLWGGADERSQYRMQVDVITSLYRNGFGRAKALEMAKRWPKYYPSDYHTEFVWQFYVFNDPGVKPRPLSKLSRCMLFSPRIDGYALWRSSWKPDATIVHFHCGDSLDMHLTADQGKFVIFKHKPLATKAGAYIGYGSALHRYYGSALSANVVAFDDGKNRWRQPSYRAKAGGVGSYKEFAKIRPALGPVVGKVLKHEVTEKYSRVVGNLDGATPDKGAKSKWTRELVFLGYEYLLVLDRVKLGPGVKCKWLLNFEKEPQVSGALVRADNPPGRLFCRTLLPEKPSYKKVGGPGAPKVMRHQWRLELTGPDAAASEQIFLNVLFPTDTGTEKMPACSVTKQGTDLVVKVGDLSYTFKPAGK